VPIPNIRRENQLRVNSSLVPYGTQPTVNCRSSGETVVFPYRL
jgi:hypothetical protein